MSAGPLTGARHDTATPDEVTLDALALRQDAPEGIPFMAAVLSWPGYSAQEMESRWEEFAGALRKLHALATLTAPWHEYYNEEDLPHGLSHQEAAIQLAATEADDARQALRFGTGFTPVHQTGRSAS
jgi:hypothetical protein